MISIVYTVQPGDVVKYYIPSTYYLNCVQPGGLD